MKLFWVLYWYSQYNTNPKQDCLKRLKYCRIINLTKINKQKA